VVLDTPDACELADFYRRPLRWQTRAEEPDWILLGAPGGSTALSFQTISPYTAAVWLEPNDQRMMLALFWISKLMTSKRRELMPQLRARTYLSFNRKMTRVPT
jgi:hypothetical protein